MERHARVLKSGDVKVRRQAIEELGKMKADAVAAAEVLQVALRKDGDEENRARAAAALGRLAPGSVAAIPALVGALEDPSSMVMLAAVAALGEFGPQAHQAIPALVFALKNVPGHSFVPDALVKIGPKAAPALEAVVLGRHPKFTVKAVMAWACEGKSASCRHDDLLPYRVKNVLLPSVRTDAAGALGRIRPWAPSTIKVLMGVLTDKTSLAGAVAATVLPKMGVPPAVLGPRLVPLLDDKNVVMQQAAAIGLGELGPGAAAHAPALVKKLGHFNNEVRAAVVTALGKLKDRSPAVLEGLTKALKDPDERVRKAATAALGQE